MGGPPGGGGGPPARRSFVGAHLNDVAASAWGFTREDLGFDEELAPAGQLTHADLICWMAPETAAYTYDTHADCVADAAACHEVQGLGLAVGETEEEETGADGDEEGDEEEEGGTPTADDEASAGAVAAAVTPLVLALPLLVAAMRC
eukprot:3359486-Rhodomonas_salina.2